MKRSGFTFIEVMISMTIFSVIIVTVYSVFYLGIKTWKRGHSGKPLQETRVAFLRMENELKKTFFFSEIKFKGTSEEMIFPLVVSDEIHTITYGVNKDENSELNQVLRKQDEEDKKAITPLMKSIKFEYAYKTQDIEWQDSWSGDELPLGVRVSLEGDEIYSKTIFLNQPDFSIP